MQTRTLTDSEKHRTRHGIIASFAEIFTGARYAKLLYSDTKRGTAHDYKEPELFLSTPIGGALAPCIKHSPSMVLVCTPVLEMPRFAPRIAPRSYNTEWTTIGPGAIKVIAWPAYGHYLVMATDPNHISNEWLGFVPMDQVFNVAGE